MSIKSTHSSDGTKLTLELDNGDKNALQQILERWNFKDEQSLLRFAMSAMITTSENAITITKKDGELQKIAPVDEFLNNK
jgi:hypothetical protein